MSYKKLLLSLLFYFRRLGAKWSYYFIWCFLISAWMFLQGLQRWWGFLYTSSLEDPGCQVCLCHHLWACCVWSLQADWYPCAWHSCQPWHQDQAGEVSGKRSPSGDKHPFLRILSSYIRTIEHENLQDAEHVLSKCMADYDSETGHDTDTDNTSNHVSVQV